MKKRNKFLKFFSACFSLSLVTVPLASCFNNTSDNRPDYDDGDNTISNPSNNESKSYVEEEIKNSINASSNLKVINVNDESGTEVYRSISEFLTKSFKEEEYENSLSKDMLIKDVYSYLYKLYVSNKGIFSFYFNKDTVVELSTNEEGNTIINLSISLKVLNNKANDQIFVFDDKSIEIKGKDYFVFNINITNEQPIFVVNSNNNRYFLGISFNNVRFSFVNSEYANQTINELSSNNKKDDENSNKSTTELIYNNFSFTKDSFSNLFLTEYTYLTDALDYNGALKHEQVNAYYNSLTDQEVQNTIENGLVSNQDLYIDILNTVNIFFSSVGSNDNGQMLIKKITPNLTKILQYFNVIPNNKEVYNLIEQLITNNEPIINVINNNNGILTTIITSLISKDPFVVNLISSLLLKFEPNMSQDEKNKLKDEINSLLNRFGAGNLTFVNGLVDVLLNNGTLLDIIQAALKEEQVVNLIKDAIGNQYSGIIDLLVSIATTDDINKPLIKIVVENASNIINLISGLIGNNETISALLKLVLSTQAGFTEENLLNLFNNTFKALTDGILNNTVVDKKFNSFTYDQENKKVSYQYQYDYVFSKEVTIDLTPLKKLFPQEINLKELGVDTASIDKMVADTQVNVIVGKVGLSTNNDVGNEWYIFKDTENRNDIKDILAQIPDSLVFGTNDKISFSYSIENQKVWINPTKTIDENWIFGIQLPYVLKISLNAPTMFNNIKNILNTVIQGEHSLNIWNDIGSAIVTILSKVYSTSGLIRASSEDKLISNFNYNDTLYMSDYNISYSGNFDSNTLNSISSFFSLESTYKYEDLNIESYFEKNNNDLEINKTLIQNYESLNLVKDELIFSYNALNSSNIGEDAIKDGSVKKGFKIRVPFRTKGTIGNIATTLDLVIYVNLSNFSNNIYLPFKIQNGSTWTNHLSTSKTSLSVDGVANVYIPYKIFNKLNYVHYGKVKFSLFNTIL